MPDFMLPKHDPMPIAEGPFYAIKMKMFHEDAIGGMTIDENASVLKNGTPIPGLYAAGDTTRGIIIPGAVGVDYIESVFSALTMAYDEGYIAGTEAAKFSKAQ
jgi:fumarate reductase flavoprotein subunit